MSEQTLQFLPDSIRPGTPRTSRLAWFNGSCVERERAAPSIASLSLHLGLGVFDGLMAYWKGDQFYLHKGREHVERFIAGAARMELRLPWHADQLLDGIQDLLRTVDACHHYVRPIAYRRAPELWVTGGLDQPPDVAVFTVALGERREFGAPLTCQISPVERISSLAIPAQTKVCGAYVNSFNARISASRAGFDDGIMLDRKGLVTEASAANIFFIKDGQLITPRLTPEIFPGITRSFILELCSALGVDVGEADIHRKDVQQFSGAFLCSTLMEVRGISRIDDRELSTRSDPIFRSVLAAFSDYVS